MIPVGITEGPKVKRAMQALLIAGEKMKYDVLNEHKQITIREGHRDYSEGPVMIGCHILNWCVVKNIVSVKRTFLQHVSIEDLNADGFENVDHALVTLRRFYPNMEKDSPVTVIKWR